VTEPRPSEKIHSQPIFGEPPPPATARNNRGPKKPKPWEAGMEVLRQHPGEFAMLAEFKAGRDKNDHRVTVKQTVDRLAWFIREVRYWLKTQHPYEDWSIMQRTPVYGHKQLWMRYNGVLNQAQYDARASRRREWEAKCSPKSTRGAVLQARRVALDRRQSHPGDAAER